MKFKNSREIIDEQLTYRRERRQYINKIISSENLQQTSDSKINNKYLKKEIKMYENKVKALESIINKYDLMLEQLATFPSDILISFLTEVISAKENKSFIYTDVVFTQSFNAMDSYYIVGATITPNYLIYETEKQKQIEKIKSALIIRHLAQPYLETLRGSEYLMFENKSYQSLLNGRKLNEIFIAYPYLEEIAYNLIDRRLLEPSKDLKEILNDELQNIKEVGLKKIKNGDIE